MAGDQFLQRLREGRDLGQRCVDVGVTQYGTAGGKTLAVEIHGGSFGGAGQHSEALRPHC
jgi:hypothetical protein